MSKRIEGPPSHSTPIIYQSVSRERNYSVIHSLIIRRQCTTIAKQWNRNTHTEIENDSLNSKHSMGQKANYVTRLYCHYSFRWFQWVVCSFRKCAPFCQMQLKISNKFHSVRALFVSVFMWCATSSSMCNVYNVYIGWMELNGIYMFELTPALFSFIAFGWVSNVSIIIVVVLFISCVSLSLSLQKTQKIGRIMHYGGQPKIFGYYEHVQHWTNATYTPIPCYTLRPCTKLCGFR